MPYRLVDPTQNPRLRAVLHAIAGLATGVLVVGGIFLAVTTYQLVDAVRDTQVSNTRRAELDRIRDEQTAAAARDAARSAERIEDCTTPGRQCFDDAQKRIGRTVGTINRYALAAAACADQPQTQTVEEIQRCILQLIEADDDDVER